MKPRAIDARPTNSRRRHPTSEENRRSPRPTPRSCPEPQRPGHSATHAQKLHSQTMRRLRVCIALLSSVVLASLAHAVIDGLTAGLALALALTTVLLLASLGLRRIGSRCAPDDRRTGRMPRR
jgi:hypothetical protein